MTTTLGTRRVLAGLSCTVATLALFGCGSAARTGGTSSVQVEQARSGGPAGASDRNCPYTKWLASSMAAPAPAPTATDSATPGNTPQADELAQALGAQGRRAAWAKVYSTLIVDYPHGRVALCVTDLAEGQLMADAARIADPKIELNRIDYYLSRYSKAQLDHASDLLVSHLGARGTLAGFPLYGLGPAQDYDGMQISTSAAGVNAPVLRAELTRLLHGIPFALAQGAPAVAAVGTATGK